MIRVYTKVEVVYTQSAYVNELLRFVREPRASLIIGPKYSSIFGNSNYGKVKVSQITSP